MRSYCLSPQAEQTLEDIIGWIIDNFGLNQAIKYKNQLINRLSSIALKDLPNGCLCDILLTGIRQTDDLEYYREGRHYIIYRNATDGIFVVDFVHSSRNLEAIIQELLEIDPR